MKFGIFCFAACCMSVHAGAPRSHSLNDLPLRFERAADGSFKARGPGYAVQLTSRESRLAFGNAQIRAILIGGKKPRRLEGLGPSQGVTNYFIGERDWRTDVSAYERVRYRGVYPGIDMVFHGERQRLEYDFLVGPGADPKRILLELAGADRVSISHTGDLILSANGTEICWKHPEIYQEINGQRRTISGGFFLDARNRVGFEIGNYDRARALVIDPALAYSTFLGGSANDAAASLALDGSGNVYISGNTNSMNLPVSAGAFQTAFGGEGSNYWQGDAFVAKFSPSGALIYLTYLGGSGDESALGLAVDSAQDVYVVGFTNSRNFPVVNPYQAQFGGMGGLSYPRTGDGFIAKLNPAGNALIYSTYLGGSQDDEVTAISVDSAGNAYVTGSTLSQNFPVTLGAYQMQNAGVGGEPVQDCCGASYFDGGDAFVAKLDPTGSKLVFSTYLGGSLDDVAGTIKVDSTGVYVAGCTISSNFPTTPGAFQRTFGGSDPANQFYNTGDGFITKLNPTGTALIYSTYFGGLGDDCITSIALDPAGNIYMTGATSSVILPTTPGVIQPSLGGYDELPFTIEFNMGDAFVGKLNPSGSALVYLTYLGGNANDFGASIAIDASGDAYIVGTTDSPNFPITKDALQTSMAGDGGSSPYLPKGDMFIAEINPTGTQLLYSTYFGGSLDDEGLALAIDSAGNVYTAGNTFSSNYKVTSNAARPTFAGAQQIRAVYWGDAFYTKFSGFATASSGPSITSVANAFGGSITIAPNTWVAIKGSGLSTGSRIWMGPDFLNNQLPTGLDGVSVTMNGVNAYVYYISGVQINALTPPNLGSGPVQVQVINGTVTSNTMTVQAQPTSPSLFVFDTAGHVVAQHVPSFTDVGPTTLYPGLTTPAQPGTEIALYGNGFGATTVPVVAGSETQSGTLSGTVSAQVNGQNAQVIFSGLNGPPGLYQFNVILPSSLPNGDLPITVIYNGTPTQSGAVITIQQ
jgi:uncharacterized protein (TIGR03437 family)